MHLGRVDEIYLPSQTKRKHTVSSHNNKIATFLSTKNIRNIIFSASVAALSIGCSGAYSNNSSQQDETLTDANIAAIVVGANKIDISAGKIALERSNNIAVKEFAERMIADHTAVLNSAVELVTRLGVTPVNNDLVAALSEQSRDHEAKLQTLSGKAFDKSYIDHEVAYHEAVIDVIENQLIPAAQNEELKATLVSVLPAFKAHLMHCKMIQSEI
jgi:putative membrane protein